MPKRYSLENGIKNKKNFQRSNERKIENNKWNTAAFVNAIRYSVFSWSSYAHTHIHTHSLSLTHTHSPLLYNIINVRRLLKVQLQQLFVWFRSLYDLFFFCCWPDKFDAHLSLVLALCLVNEAEKVRIFAFFSFVRFIRALCRDAVFVLKYMIPARSWTVFVS